MTPTRPPLHHLHSLFPTCAPAVASLEAAGKAVVVLGDLNVAHAPADVAVHYRGLPFQTYAAGQIAFLDNLFGRAAVGPVGPAAVATVAGAGMPVAAAPTPAGTPTAAGAAAGAATDTSGSSGSPTTASTTTDSGARRLPPTRPGLPYFGYPFGRHVDSWRAAHPSTSNVFTVFERSTNARERNDGTRIDFIALPRSWCEPQAGSTASGADATAAASSAAAGADAAVRPRFELRLPPLGPSAAAAGAPAAPSSSPLPSSAPQLQLQPYAGRFVGEAELGALLRTPGGAGRLWAAGTRARPPRFTPEAVAAAGNGSSARGSGAGAGAGAVAKGPAARAAAAAEARAKALGAAAAGGAGASATVASDAAGNSSSSGFGASPSIALPASAVPPAVLRALALAPFIAEADLPALTLPGACAVVDVPSSWSDHLPVVATFIAPPPLPLTEAEAAAGGRRFCAGSSRTVYAASSSAIVSMFKSAAAATATAPSPALSSASSSSSAAAAITASSLLRAASGGTAASTAAIGAGGSTAPAASRAAAASAPAGAPVAKRPRPSDGGGGGVQATLHSMFGKGGK